VHTFITASRIHNVCLLDEKSKVQRKTLCFSPSLD